MARVKLKSYEFRRERESAWRELEGLVRRAERGGIKSLSSDELLRLPSLYRATMSSLSVARGISLDQNVLTYLESLAARAYFVVYGVRAHTREGVAGFLLRGFPGAVRAARGPIVTAALFMALGFATGFVLTLHNADWFYTFIPANLGGDRSPTASTEDLRATLYDTGCGVAEMLYAFAAFLFTHNSAVGMLAFALGFALGVPTILLMFYNGLTLGAFAALFESRGLSVELWAWLGIHGTTELFAVVLCGGAGLLLGRSLAFPGRHGRLDNLARNGRMAGQIVIGAVAMLFIAGLLEGLGRQLIVDPTERYLIAVSALILWLLYFLRVGKEERDGDDR